MAKLRMEEPSCLEQRTVGFLFWGSGELEQGGGGSCPGQQADGWPCSELVA